MLKAHSGVCVYRVEGCVVMLAHVVSVTTTLLWQHVARLCPS